MDMMKQAATKKPLFHLVIGSSVHIAQNVKVLPKGDYHYFSTEETISYRPFCDDFGPMNMSSVFKFIQLLDSEMECHAGKKIVYMVESGKRNLANAVFLMGSYLILKLNYTSQRVMDTFSWANENVIAHFRDATFSNSDFDLTLLDCWKGLEKGKRLEWVSLPVKQTRIWGRIRQEEYELFDDPLNADLHEVIPGKFVAFVGPKDLSRFTSNDYYDDKKGYRRFSPNHFVKIFKFLGATTVIRLNQTEYDSSMFTKHGIRHHDLEFSDCTAPPVDVVESFFRIVDSAPDGAIAVHCKAGLGRTGTLIALYLMRSHGFSAREAIGWLRIMRPGSIIGEQQQYLCAIEANLTQFARAASAAAAAAAAGGGTPKSLRASSIPPLLAKPIAAAAAAAAAAGSSAVGEGRNGPAALAAQVAEGMHRRGASVAAAAAAAAAGAGAGAARGLRRSGGGGGGGGGSEEEARPGKWLPSIKSALVMSGSLGAGARSVVTSES